MWQIWIIVSGIFFILEMITTGFLVFWLGIGALFAMITSFITDNVFIQFLVFLVTSSILLFFTKPLVDRYFNNKKTVPTNAFSIIGKKAVVIQEINPLTGTGQIKLGGEVWAAKTPEENIIAKDAEVEITSIEGVKACVKLIPAQTISSMEISK